MYCSKPTTPVLEDEGTTKAKMRWCASHTQISVVCHWPRSKAKQGLARPRKASQGLTPRLRSSASHVDIPNFCSVEPPESDKPKKYSQLLVFTMAEDPGKNRDRFSRMRKSAQAGDLQAVEQLMQREHETPVPEAAGPGSGPG